ncbi:proline-rich protein HaeIII subfamily 1-like [Canis lupus dingo]|uniref:proline-rich protein HaeIII subfamily 1-like n=1 Tax=Canis lupus dingo TaxID=286419 RepID=UPI0020C3D8A7|nr:proline-rich protein HaeIII subfamily 1-like [Canis lupus dingo]
MLPALHIPRDPPARGPPHPQAETAFRSRPAHVSWGPIAVHQPVGSPNRQRATRGRDGAAGPAPRRRPFWGGRGGLGRGGPPAVVPVPPARPPMGAFRVQLPEPPPPPPPRELPPKGRGLFGGPRLYRRPAGVPVGPGGQSREPRRPRGDRDSKPLGRETRLLVEEPDFIFE